MTNKNRVTLQDIEDNIAQKNFVNMGNAVELCGQPASERLFCLTICTLTMKNGFVVVGESSCVDVHNYDRTLGEKYAYEDALKKVWPLMGYELRSQLAG